MLLNKLSRVLYEMRSTQKTNLYIYEELCIYIIQLDVHCSLSIYIYIVSRTLKKKKKNIKTPPLKNNE